MDGTSNDAPPGRPGLAGLSPVPGPAVNPLADPGAAPAPPRLLERLREAIRVRHYSIRTEDAYADWARRFILFHGKRHPSALGAADVAAFLTPLAVARGVDSEPASFGRARAARQRAPDPGAKRSHSPGYVATAGSWRYRGQARPARLVRTAKDRRRWTSPTCSHWAPVWATSSWRAARRSRWPSPRPAG
ncbi:MAG: site-specific integrase [Burkholderiaceae bacterium]